MYHTRQEQSLVFYLAGRRKALRNDAIHKLVFEAQHLAEVLSKSRVASRDDGCKYTRVSGPRKSESRKCCIPAILFWSLMLSWRPVLPPCYAKTPVTMLVLFTGGTPLFQCIRCITSRPLMCARPFCLYRRTAKGENGSSP